MLEVSNLFYLDQNIAEFIEHVTSYEIHKSKLDAIKREIQEKQSNKYKVLDEKSELLKLRILNNKLKSHEFVENEKINQIRKNNQLLLDRLLDISKGRWAAPGMKAKQRKRRVGPKSLNYVTKRRELERIDNENMKLMKRIVNQNAMLSTKKHEKEYRERKRLQKSLQRNRFAPIQNMLKKKKQFHEKSTGRLPPLQNSDTPSVKDSKEQRIKMPHSVSGSKKQHNTFEIDDKVEQNKIETEDNKISEKGQKTPEAIHSKSTSKPSIPANKPFKHTPVRPVLFILFQVLKQAQANKSQPPKPKISNVQNPVKTSKPAEVKKPTSNPVSKTTSKPVPASKPSDKKTSQNLQNVPVQSPSRPDFAYKKSRDENKGEKAKEGGNKGKSNASSNKISGISEKNSDKFSKKSSEKFSEKQIEVKNEDKGKRRKNYYEA